MPNPDEEWLTVADCAARLGITNKRAGAIAARLVAPEEVQPGRPPRRRILKRVLWSAFAEIAAPGRLTPTQLQILRLSCSGMNREEIADKVCLSPKTVSFHLQAIYRKLDVHNIMSAYNAAIKAGLLEPPAREIP